MDWNRRCPSSLATIRSGSILKVIVINSNGPMGSTVVGAILEQCGFVNLPIRRYGTERRLLNGPDEDEAIVKVFIEVIGRHDKPVRLGGTSLEHRDGSECRLVDSKKVLRQLHDLLEQVTKESVKFSELYQSLRTLYLSAVIYKDTSLLSEDKHIEYSVELQDYDYSELSRKYKTEFDDVLFIHTRRKFDSWFESRIGALFTNSLNLNKRFILALFHRYSIEHKKYTEFVNGTPDPKVDFEDLFGPRRSEVIQKICSLAGESAEAISWEERDYYLYGKRASFETTFTLSDHPSKYLSRWTLTISRASYNCKNRIGQIVAEILMAVLCQFDYWKFRRSRS